MTQVATLTSIARDLKIAVSTVSSALSGKAARYGIKPETVRLVTEYAARVGYVPNGAARQLRRRGEAPIGILFDPSVRAGEMVSQALTQAVSAIQKRGREVRVVAAPSCNDGCIQLRELGCREVIVFSKFTESPGSAEDLDHSLRTFQAATAQMTIYTVNYVFHDRETPLFPQIVRLGIHRQQTMRILSECFREFVHPDLLVHALPDGRLLGDGECRLPARPELENVPYQRGRVWAHDLLAMRKSAAVSVLLLGDDRTAAGLIAELTGLGVNIPEEVRIVSFDNLEFSDCLAVPLSSWGVPILKHVTMVLDSILDGKELPRRLVSMPEFRWRKSCGLTPAQQREVERRCAEELEKFQQENVKP